MTVDLGQILHVTFCSFSSLVVSASGSGDKTRRRCRRDYDAVKWGLGLRRPGGTEL